MSRWFVCHVDVDEKCILIVGLRKAHSIKICWVRYTRTMVNIIKMNLALCWAVGVKCQKERRCFLIILHMLNVYAEKFTVWISAGEKHKVFCNKYRCRRTSNKRSNNLNASKNTNMNFSSLVKFVPIRCQHSVARSQILFGSFYSVFRVCGSLFSLKK